MEVATYQNKYLFYKVHGVEIEVSLHPDTSLSSGVSWGQQGENKRFVNDWLIGIITSPSYAAAPSAANFKSLAQIKQMSFLNKYIIVRQNSKVRTLKAYFGVPFMEGVTKLQFKADQPSYTQTTFQTAGPSAHCGLMNPISGAWDGTRPTKPNICYLVAFPAYNPSSTLTGLTVPPYVWSLNAEIKCRWFTEIFGRRDLDDPNTTDDPWSETVTDTDTNYWVKDPDDPNYIPRVSHDPGPGTEMPNP